MTDYPLLDVVKSRDPFFNFALKHIFGIGKAKHFKLRVLIVAQ